MKKKAAAKKTPTNKVAVEKAATKKSGRPAKAAPKVAQAVVAEAPQKNAFQEKFGEGTAFDLDYGKLLIISVCIYIAVQVSSSMNISETMTALFSGESASHTDTFILAGVVLALFIGIRTHFASACIAKTKPKLINQRWWAFFRLWDD